MWVWQIGGGAPCCTAVSQQPSSCTASCLPYNSAVLHTCRVGGACCLLRNDHHAAQRAPGGRRRSSCSRVICLSQMCAGPASHTQRPLAHANTVQQLTTHTPPQNDSLRRINPAAAAQLCTAHLAIVPPDTPPFEPSMADRMRAGRRPQRFFRWSVTWQQLAAGSAGDAMVTCMSNSWLAGTVGNNKGTLNARCHKLHVHAFSPAARPGRRARSQSRSRARCAASWLPLRHGAWRSGAARTPFRLGKAKGGGCFRTSVPRASGICYKTNATIDKLPHL